MQVLKAINFKDDATFLLNANGIKVTVEDAKAFQVWVARWHIFKPKIPIWVNF
jgi:hypothetical protein